MPEKRPQDPGALKAVLTSGYYKSPHAIALLCGLRELGFDVRACLSVRAFQWKRARQLVRHQGLPFLWRKFRGRILGAPAGSREDDTAAINAYLRERGIRHATLRAACRDLGVEYADVEGLNHPEALAAVDRHAPDLAVYSGGGILRKAFIQRFSRGVLNAHSGPLPFFRGMNALEWSLWHGVRPALTVHYINAGIDTGDILAVEPIPVERGDTLVSLRAKAIRLGVETLLKVAGDLDAYHRGRRPQEKSEGAQFFVMHPFLREILEARLAAGVPDLLDHSLFAGFSRPKDALVHSR